MRGVPSLRRRRRRDRSKGSIQQFGNTNHTFNSIEHKQYDLILHDGSHIGSEVLIDLNNIYPYLKHDGILITYETRHHTLGGDMTKAVNDFAQGEDMEMLTLPYGYGLM